MPRNSVVGLLNSAQNRSVHVPTYAASASCAAATLSHSQVSLATCSYRIELGILPLASAQKVELSDVVSAGVTATQDSCLRHFISLVRLARPYSVEDYAMSILVNRLRVAEPIAFQAPKKHILASMKVRLSPKDFRRRLPKPVISVE